MASIMPHLRFATLAVDATDSFVFMALGPSVDGVGASCEPSERPSGAAGRTGADGEASDHTAAGTLWGSARAVTGTCPRNRRILKRRFQ